MRFLRNITETALKSDPIGANIAPVEKDISTGRFKETNKHFDRSAFPSAIWSKIAKDLTGTNRAADAIHGGNPMVAFNKIADFQHDPIP
jgi:hypothetical protein